MSKKKSPKKSSKPKKTPLKNVFGFLFIASVLIIGIVIFVSNEDSSPVEYTLNVDVENLSGIGWTLINVSSNIELESVDLVIDGQSTWYRGLQDGKHVFQFWVSPYAAIGPHTITVTATSADGQSISTSDIGIFVGYNVYGDLVNELILYSTFNSPVIQTQAILGSSDEINFFFELSDNTKINADVIRAFLPLVERLGEMKGNVTSYGILTLDGDWVSCTDANQNELPLPQCEQVLENELSVILKSPLYPVDQIEVTENAIILRPSLEGLEYTVNAFIESTKPISLPSLNIKEVIINAGNQSL